MSKNTTVALIILFVLVLLSLVIYAVVTMLNASTTSKKDKNTNTTPLGTQSEMDAFVQEFRTKFEAVTGYRCDVIEKANSFDNTQLKNFASTYKSTYGITVLEQMDKAWLWCIQDLDSSRALHDKLKAL